MMYHVLRKRNIGDIAGPSSDSILHPLREVKSTIDVSVSGNCDTVPVQCIQTTTKTPVSLTKYMYPVVVPQSLWIRQRISLSAILLAGGPLSPLCFVFSLLSQLQ
jgi:hypothetical protein